MHTLRSLALASLFTALSAHANKGAVYEAPPIEPDFARFTLIGGATYLVPSMNGLDYVTIETQSDAGVVSENPLQIDRDYNWGYYLAAAFMINQRYDLQVSWTQYNADNENTTIPCSTCGTVTSNLTVAQYDVSTDEDLDTEAFDVTLGQYHEITDNLTARIFAGVRYAKISNDTSNLYVAVADPSFSFNEIYDSSFSGWGPELGFDVNYDIYEWFTIVGHFAGALLIGEQDSDSDLFLPINEGLPVLIDADTDTRLVPALDAKLGLQLNVPIMNKIDRFIFQAGYQAAVYFDVVDQITTGGVFVEAAPIHNYANVGIMGPYANLGFTF